MFDGVSGSQRWGLHGRANEVPVKCTNRLNAGIDENFYSVLILHTVTLSVQAATGIQ